MSKDSCILVPEINGKPSKLYQDLLKKENNRPLINYVYACYVSNPSLQQAMDSAGYRRNAQGQHTARSVYAFFHIKDMVNEALQTSNIEYSLGFANSSFKRIDFDKASEALQKAKDFNDSHDNLIATVLQHGKAFQIKVMQKNSKTLANVDFVNSKLKIADLYNQVFTTIGVDIQAMPDELLDTFGAWNDTIYQSLKNLSSMRMQDLHRKEALALLYLYETSPQVQRVVSIFGSLEEAAQAIEDINFRGKKDTAYNRGKLVQAISYCQQLNGLDLDLIKQQVQDISDQIIENSEAQPIIDTINHLNDLYGIDKEVLVQTEGELKKLSDAATEAVIVLQRKIRKLQREFGNNAEGKKLRQLQKQLQYEVQSKKYYAGLLNFLTLADSQLQDIDNLILSIRQSGSDFEQIKDQAKTLQEIKELIATFKPIVHALANPALEINENISTQDVQNLRSQAEKIDKFITEKEKELSGLADTVNAGLIEKIIGQDPENEYSVANVVAMAQTESLLAFMDRFYGFGRASNPIISIMGTITRDAQDKRNVMANAFALRIRRATDKLYKTSNSEFMYEKNGYIISDIDWDLYNKAKSRAISSFKAQGLKDFDLKEAIENWEENNTEDRVVDKINGRTERVPNSSYRKEFPVLTAEQQEYYDEMMQIKGEIGSLLPDYAQNHYLPPQVRRETVDAIKDAHGLKDVGKAVWNKVSDIWTVRENDEDFNQNAMVDGEEALLANGDFYNYPERSIPIFHVKALKDQNELLKNFSTALTFLMGTAVNYTAMNEVKDVVEFMGDYLKDLPSTGPKTKIERFATDKIVILKKLYSRAGQEHTKDVVDAYINHAFYNVKIKEGTNPQFAKLVKSVIAYTSFKELSTNVKGMVSNHLMGECQMMIEAGAGEFYGIKNYLKAHLRLFGSAGVPGEISELLTNNRNHKATLIRDYFDPLNEEFSEKTHKRYYRSAFRQLISKDCSFIGYSAGEYLIHYVNMYAILDRVKVLHNGKVISLYDAFELTDKQDGNKALVLKQGVTTLDGNAITEEFIDKVKKQIRYCNQTCHGSMNEEDKGYIHQSLLGKSVLNFRQWMVEHYSRRFRGKYWDATLKQWREGYYTTTFKWVRDDFSEKWQNEQRFKAIGTIFKDFLVFTFRATAYWGDLTDRQKANVKRAHSEFMTFLVLLLFQWGLGAPDKDKDPARRFWLYQIKRLILDYKASMPGPGMIGNMATLIDCPIPSEQTFKGFAYVFWIGLTNGDLKKKIKKGKYKGENIYWYNTKKYALPFYKHWEEMVNLASNEALFKSFDNDNPWR